MNCYSILYSLSDIVICILTYLFTWNFVQPSAKYALICFAAARPALVLAYAVCDPIFLGVEK